MALSEAIIVTGPESTGKTSIAEYLTQYSGGILMQEYAREYVAQLTRRYTYSDIEVIAKWQFASLASLSKQPNRPIIVDTYLIITKIWFQWHSNKYPGWLDEALINTKNCIYLLCKPDIDWVADDVRENGGENRIKLFNSYKAELEKYNLQYNIIEGEGENRLKMAVKSINSYLKQ